MILYVDTSSLAKVLIAEPETEATRTLLASATRLVTSEITGLELRRLHHRIGRTDGDERTVAVLAGVSVVRIDADILAEAGILNDPDLRSLDAIHLATALQLADAIAGVATHDTKLAEAAERHGLTAHTPT